MIKAQGFRNKLGLRKSQLRENYSAHCNNGSKMNKKKYIEASKVARIYQQIKDEVETNQLEKKMELKILAIKEYTFISI